MTSLCLSSKDLLYQLLPICYFQYNFIHSIHHKNSLCFTLTENLLFLFLKLISFLKSLFQEEHERILNKFVNLIYPKCKLFALFIILNIFLFYFCLEITTPSCI